MKIILSPTKTITKSIKVMAILCIKNAHKRNEEGKNEERKEGKEK